MVAQVGVALVNLVGLVDHGTERIVDSSLKALRVSAILEWVIGVQQNLVEQIVGAVLFVNAQGFISVRRYHRGFSCIFDAIGFIRATYVRQLGQRPDGHILLLVPLESRDAEALRPAEALVKFPGVEGLKNLRWRGLHLEAFRRR